MRVRRPVVLISLGVLLMGACSSSTTPGSTTATTTGAPQPRIEVLWPPPADPMVRTVAAGLVPETHETLVHHVHAHLDVFIDGVHQIVPGGIGIRIDDPAVKHSKDLLGQDGYGGISPPCETPCISPLHTHSADGVLHTESATAVDNTLGQFFVEWGVKLDRQCVGEYCSPEWPVAFYVDGQRLAGGDEPSAITLTDRRQISIVIGKAPADIPATFRGA